MKILVMGTGAVGGCFGGMLKYAGYDVVFYARGENFSAIRSSGLHVDSVAAGKFSITPTVVKNIEKTTNKAIKDFLKKFNFIIPLCIM